MSDKAKCPIGLCQNCKCDRTIVDAMAYGERNLSEKFAEGVPLEEFLVEGFTSEGFISEELSMKLEDLQHMQQRPEPIVKTKKA